MKTKGGALSARYGISGFSHEAVKSAWAKAKKTRKAVYIGKKSGPWPRPYAYVSPSGTIRFFASKISSSGFLKLAAKDRTYLKSRIVELQEEIKRIQTTLKKGRYSATPF